MAMGLPSQHRFVNRDMSVRRVCVHVRKKNVRFSEKQCTVFEWNKSNTLITIC